MISQPHSSDPVLFHRETLTEEVATLSIEPTVPDMSVAMAFVVVPEVARRLRMTPDDPSAFLSFDQIASMVGCSRRNVEKYAAHTSLVLVRRGGVWKSKTTDGVYASEWSLAAAPATSLAIDVGPLDPTRVTRWLDPRGAHWTEAGLRAWRLVLALVVACGPAHVTVSASAAADVLGCSRSTGARALRAVRALPGAEETESGLAMDLGLMMAAGASVQDREVETPRDRMLKVISTRWTAAYRRRCAQSGHRPVVEYFTRDDVIAAYGEGCFYCPEGQFEELDHFIPVAAGGVHTLANVRPSCEDCNGKKSDTVLRAS